MRRNDWKTNLTLLLLVLSVALNVVLSKKLVALQQPVTTLQVGERVPDMKVKSLAGSDITISYPADRPTLVYYFSPTCGWCERNWANFKTILESSHGQFRVVGLSPTDKDVDKVLREHHVQFDVYTGVPPEISRAYHLTGTPQTVLVSAKGTVLGAWSGAYANAQAKEVLAYLGFKLPGVARRAARP